MNDLLGPIFGRTAFRGWITASLLLAPASLAARSSPPPSPLAGIKALDKSVTYSETKIPLGELVQKVAADTGVTLTAARDVADEPVAVVVKEMPARELLEQVAELLDYRWRRLDAKQAEARGAADRSSAGGSASSRVGRPVPGTKGSTPEAEAGTPALELWQDLAGKHREESLRQALLSQVEARFHKQIQAYSELGERSPAETETMLAEDRREEANLSKLTPEQEKAVFNSAAYQARLYRMLASQMLQTPLSRTLAGMLGHLSAQQWEMLRSEQPIMFSTQPARGELPLPEAVARRFRTAPLTQPPVLARVNSLDPAEEAQIRQQDQQAQDQWANAAGYKVQIGLISSTFKTEGSLGLNVHVWPIPGPGASPAEFDCGDCNIYVSASPDSPGVQAGDGPPPELGEVVKDPVYGLQREIRPQATPQTHLWGPDGPSGWRARDLLPDLARIYGVQFVSDAYGFGSDVSAGELASARAQALWEILYRWFGTTYRWDRQERLIRLRHRYWFIERPREVPLRLIRRWQALADRNGALSMPEYVSIAVDLTDAQLLSLQRLNLDARTQIVPPDVATAYEVRDNLRLYASLSTARQRRMWQGPPMMVSQMSPQQRQLFLSALHEYNRRSTPPISLEQASVGGLSLAADRLVRVRGPQGEAVQNADAPAVQPGGAVGAGALAVGSGAPLSNPGVAPSPTRRFRVLRAYFQYHMGQETSRGVGIIVTEPS